MEGGDNINIYINICFLGEKTVCLGYYICKKMSENRSYLRIFFKMLESQRNASPTYILCIILFISGQMWS